MSLNNEVIALKTQINYSLFILRIILRICTHLIGEWL